LQEKVTPLVVKGLTVLCKEKPQDPILFLANWLLENNPSKPRVVAPIPTQGGGSGGAAHKYKTKKDVYFVLGGPGCGKGTQCARLADEFRLAHLSTGDLLRAEIAKGTAEGQTIAAIMKEGRLVPQDLVIRLLAQAIIASDKKGVLVDGFPRSVEQLAKFEELMKPCKFAILFDCSEAAMLKRIMKRAEATPADQRRPDDNPEVASKRFRTFRMESEPAITRLKQEGRLIAVSAEADIDTVHKQVRQLFL
jgi:adenylate kinase family enzyme